MGPETPILAMTVFFSNLRRRRRRRRRKGGSVGAYAIPSSVCAFGH